MSASAELLRREGRTVDPMQHDEQTVERIRAWVIEHFPLAKKRDVGVDESLLEGGIIDSLGTLEVVMFLEEEFDVIVSDEEMVADHFESVSSIAAYVASKTRTAGSERTG